MDSQNASRPTSRGDRAARFSGSGARSEPVAWPNLRRHEPGRDPIDYGDEIREAIAEDGDSLTVAPEWEGFPGQAFGGFAAAAVLVAASSRTDKPRPLSLFARFQRPIPLGRAVTLDLQTERSGRSVDTLAGTLRDGDRDLARFTAAFGIDGEAPLQSQAVPPMPPLRQPTPVASFIEAAGFEAPPLMRRVGYRGEAGDADLPNIDGPDWHIRNQWPATASQDLAVRAAMALMAIDIFVAPAAILANGVDISGPWPVIMPSLDLTAWFYAPEAPSLEADEQSPSGWLNARTSVPVSNAGYAVGRTQVWSGERLVAEGMSQVAMVPAPPSS